MKNIFYFLVVFLITLCGCKSNSFMTQRYTHLKHSKASSSLQVSNTEKRNKEKTKSIETVSLKDQVPETISLVASSENKTASNAGTMYFLPKKMIKPLLKVASRATNELKNDKGNNPEQKVIGKKSLKEKTHQARGVISLAFKIVLLAIVLAILVAVIIIIVLT